MERERENKEKKRGTLNADTVASQSLRVAHQDSSLHFLLYFCELVVA